MRTPEEAANFAKTRFKFEPRTSDLPETTTIEEAKKAEQEFGINKPAKVKDFKAEATKRTSIDDLIDEYNANQDRLLLTDDEGGTLITYPEYNRLKDRNDEIAKALEEKGIKSTPEVEEVPEGIVIPFKKKPPEEFAEGGITRTKFASGGKGKKVLDIIKNANKKLKGKKSMETVNPKTGEITIPDEFITTAEKQTKEFTDDEMIAYIKKYKEEGPTLEEFTKRINEETGSNFTPEQLKRAYGIKIAYPHSTPIIDSQGKYIGGGLYNPPLDVSISDTETLTESIMQTRKTKGLDVPEKYQKAGEGRFTKQQVLERILQSTIDANPTDEYVQKTFPNFIKEIKANPELANNENVWKTFTQDFPENKKLVVYGDDTVDFFTKGENLPEGMKQTQDLANTYGIDMKEAMRIKQMEPEDQVMEIKKLEVLKNKAPEVYDEFSKSTNRMQELLNFRSGQETFETFDLETYNYLNSQQIGRLLNQLKNPYKISDKERTAVTSGFTRENLEGTGLKNLDEINFRTDKKQLETYLDDLYNKKQVEEAETELFNLKDSGREPNANGGLNYLMGF
jgi:hypothetical protein